MLKGLSIHFRGNLEVAQSLPVIPTETDNQIRLLAVLFPDYDSTNTLTSAQIVKQVLQQYDGGATGSPLAPYTTMYSPYKARIDNINNQAMVKYKVLFPYHNKIHQSIQIEPDYSRVKYPRSVAQKFSVMELIVSPFLKCV